jgi:hypothetical protein
MTSTAPRAALAPATFGELPLGAVQPRGWLAEQLRLQADGLTGALEEIWPDVGPNSAWLGGTGEAWERGPYYLDGLVPLAHVLRDEPLLAKAQRWIDAIIAGQRADGSFGPGTNDDWWPRMIALKALTQHAEATGDDRVAAFLAAYFQHQLAELPDRPLRDWGRARGADNALSVLWLYERVRDEWLRDLAELIVDQTADWGSYLTEFPVRDVARSWDYMTHVVNVAMGLKAPMVRYLLDGAVAHRDAIDAGLANLDRYHGQVHGMFSGDEWLAGPAATRGVELCAVVECMFSLEQLVHVFGETAYADRLERLAYNLLPATLTAEVTAHQYHQQANQVLVSIAQREWTQADDDCTIFGLEPNFGCCTANLHQGWPKLMKSLWLTTPDGGLAAVVHAPSTVRATFDDGATVEIEAATGYPFEDTIRYAVRPNAPRTFPLRLRIPGWCTEPVVTVNGATSNAAPADGFVGLAREWRTGDLVELRLPMTPHLIERPRGAAGIALGPLVLAYSPGEIWERIPDSPAFGDWEVRPRRGWNIALAVDASTVASAVRVERFGPQSPPFGLRSGRPPHGVSGVPLTAWVPAQRVAGWGLEHNSAAAPPEGPLELDGIARPVPLVPYGSARIRIAEFPTARPESMELLARGEPPP